MIYIATLFYYKSYIGMDTFAGAFSTMFKVEIEISDGSIRQRKQRRDIVGNTYLIQ